MSIVRNGGGGSLVICLQPAPKTSGGGSAGGTVLAQSSGGRSQRFRELVRQWKKATAFVSSTTEIVIHPAYQQIIGMGSEALPLIFFELRRQPSQWFWALKAITGEDPVALADRGKVRRMAQSWLEWAERRGF